MVAPNRNKENLLTQDLVKRLFIYDPGAGTFIRRISTGPTAPAGKVPGWADRYGYRMVQINDHAYCVHRLIWLYQFNEWPIEIDHINGDRTDNRLANLRSVTHAENGKNQRLHSTNKSGRIGVYWDKASRKWIAHIYHSGKQWHLGSFADKRKAVAVRADAERKYSYHENHGSQRT